MPEINNQSDADDHQSSSMIIIPYRVNLIVDVQSQKKTTVHTYSKT